MAEDEVKQEGEVKPAEQKPDFLLEVRTEREKLEKVRDENKQLVAELRELRAKEIFGGNTNAGQQSIKPPEISAREYSEKAIRGEFNKPKEK